MRRSFLLWLRLLGARSKAGDQWGDGARTVPRPDGPLIWIVAHDPSEFVDGPAEMLLRRIIHMRPDLAIVVSTEAYSVDHDSPGYDPAGVSPAANFPDVLIARLPGESRAAARTAITHWDPDLIVFMGHALPTSLIVTAADMHVPMIAIDLHGATNVLPTGYFARRIEAALLSRLDRIITRDAQAQAQLIKLGISPARTEVGGVLSAPPDPLHCSEAERTSIAAITRSRPIWLAAAVPQAELRLVLAAHARASRHAHRMLLILAPDDSGPADALADALEAEGWITGQRSIEGEPEEEMQIFLADDPDEYGLWYRIAPITYMGGTLSKDNPSRSPIEPAALGSAILHGPETQFYQSDFSRLDAARAARVVSDEETLGIAVADLMSPDRAAMLAHNAWAVTSGGAGAAESVARSVISVLDTHLTRRAQSARLSPSEVL